MLTKPILVVVVEASNIALLDLLISVARQQRAAERKSHKEAQEGQADLHTGRHNHKATSAFC